MDIKETQYEGADWFHLPMLPSEVGMSCELIDRSNVLEGYTVPTISSEHGGGMFV
jgi:hypothetical protein